MCLLLFIALNASGWGSVLAAAICPHAGEMSKSAVMAEDHACCHARLAHRAEHCETADAPASMDGMQMPVAEASGVFADLTELSPQSLSACELCLGKSAPLPAPVSPRGQSQNNRAADALAATAQPLVATQTFKLPVLNRQGAPPGTSTRKHLLNNVFLI